jgi:hypothetical protein
LSVIIYVADEEKEGDQGNEPFRPGERRAKGFPNRLAALRGMPAFWSAALRHNEKAIAMGAPHPDSRWYNFVNPSTPPRKQSRSERVRAIRVADR